MFSLRKHDAVNLSVYTPANPPASDGRFTTGINVFTVVSDTLMMALTSHLNISEQPLCDKKPSLLPRKTMVSPVGLNRGDRASLMSGDEHVEGGIDRGDERVG